MYEGRTQTVLPFLLLNSGELHVKITKTWNQGSPQSFWPLFLLFAVTAACNPAFLKGVKPIIANVMCAATKLSATTLARDIAIQDVRHYPFWRNGQPISLQEQRDFCIDRIRAEKYVILEKPWKGKDHFTTTLPLPQLDRIPGWLNIPGADQLPNDTAGVVLTRNGIDRDPLLRQVVTYCHELVHVYAEKRLGLLTSGIVFLKPSTRVGFELPAYGVTLALHYLNGADMSKIETRAANVIDSLHENYLLRSIPKDCLHQTAVEYWKSSSWLQPITLRSDFAIKGTH